MCAEQRKTWEQSRSFWEEMCTLGLGQPGDRFLRGAWESERREKYILRSTVLARHSVGVREAVITRRGMRGT